MLACLLKVLCLNIFKCIDSNTFKRKTTLFGMCFIFTILNRTKKWTPLTFFIWKNEAPVKYREADSWRLPTGVLPTQGWLFHCLKYSQCGQRWSIATKVPLLRGWISQALEHTGQVSNSSRRQFSNTIYFVSSWEDLDVYMLSQKKIKKKKIEWLLQGTYMYAKLNTAKTKTYECFDGSVTLVTDWEGSHFTSWVSQTSSKDTLSSPSSNSKRRLLAGLSFFKDVEVKGCEVVQGMVTSTPEIFVDSSVCVSIKLKIQCSVFFYQISLQYYNKFVTLGHKNSQKNHFFEN